MEFFGCCSRYVECSDNRRCSYAADPEYARCAYRANLEAGRIFYGVNAGTKNIIQAAELPIVPDDLKPINTARIASGQCMMLYCYNRLFCIFSRAKNSLSMELTPEQISQIEAAFMREGIPFKTQIDSMIECVIDRPTEEDPMPANARVVFEYDGGQYYILNYNSWLIKRRIAEQIAKALDNHFITARVELVGKYANANKITPYKPEWKPVTKSIDAPMVKAAEAPESTKVSAPQPEKKTNDKLYTQVSIFDVLQQPIDEIPATRVEIQKTRKRPVRKKKREEYRFSGTGQIVIAWDEYWGAYKCELLGNCKSYSEVQIVLVRIIETLRQPRQDAVIFKDAKVHRQAYPAGSIQKYRIDSVRCLDAQPEFSETG